MASESYYPYQIFNQANIAKYCIQIQNVVKKD